MKRPAQQQGCFLGQNGCFTETKRHVLLFSSTSVCFGRQPCATAQVVGASFLHRFIYGTRFLVALPRTVEVWVCGASVLPCLLCLGTIFHRSTCIKSGKAARRSPCRRRRGWRTICLGLRSCRQNAQDCKGLGCSVGV